MADIYKQHDAAFSHVSAFIITRAGGCERVATVAFKFPRDGAGRLYCYLHVLGLPMVRGSAGGYGYDKKSAAFHDAANKQREAGVRTHASGDNHLIEYAIAQAFVDCFTDGGNWDRDLHEAGFTVLQAV